jgi:tetratricopeptide (TPR) repeat protein
VRPAHPLVLTFLALGCGKPNTAAPTTPPAATPTASADAHPPSWSLDELAKSAVKLDDLGDVHRTITTSSPEAQAFFDQGLALTWGFNHDEAARSFAKAGALDADCAMCWWGAAYTLGPNYNIPMLPDRAEAAWDAIGRAKAAAAKATPVEQALVEALSKRYAGPQYLEPPAMQPYNEAYAGAMRDVAKAFPDDLDVQVLFAEAMMNVNPWRLWTPAGDPAPGTEELVAALEGVLAKSPTHVGANHYYIHAIEASKTPEKGIAAADRLGALVPGAGHLVHMPAHIYQRVGRYADASEANRRAIGSDETYLQAVTPPGYYPFYLGHNYGFLAYSASMEGKSEESLKAARAAAERIPKDVVCGMPGMDFFLSEPLLVMVRFGKWDAILAEPAPDPKYQVLTALWHHARGMALAATGKPDEAQKDLEAISAVRKALPEGLVAGLNAGSHVLDLSAKILQARIAEARGQDAIALWEEAVALEDQLAYSEPSDWFYPVRHFLGAALLDAGKAVEAEAVYRADLERNPNNGWALYGVWQSLKAQNKKGAAKKAEKAFRAAWPDADFDIVRTAF